MGYTTDFSGEFRINPPLRPEHRAYLQAFSETRRMKRDPLLAELLPDPLRRAVGLPIGEDAAFCVEASEDLFGTGGRKGKSDVVDANQPPHGQPGLWCQWVPSSDGGCLEWDQGDKFYDYDAWLRYLLDHFLKPWGYVLDGEVFWQGEESDDRGKLVIRKNRLRVYQGITKYVPR